MAAAANERFYERELPEAGDLAVVKVRVSLRPLRVYSYMTASACVYKHMSVDQAMSATHSLSAGCPSPTVQPRL